MLKFFLLSASFSLFLIPMTALIHEDPDQLLEWCIDSQNHKSKPGPENGLHNQCKPWQNRSCCTSKTTVQAHYDPMYNFEWNHCRHTQDLSEKCRKHFVQDLCFYECSPNVGPWTVTVKQKFRSQRFLDVPICATDCDHWFEDCADDYTCTDNWGRNFDWIDGVNKCPAGSTCLKFRDIYRTSKNFCERVWDHSWKYTPNNEPCMRIWFDGTAFNPNDAVALAKVKQIKKALGIASFASKCQLNIVVIAVAGLASIKVQF